MFYLLSEGLFYYFGVFMEAAVTIQIIDDILKTVPYSTQSIIICSYAIHQISQRRERIYDVSPKTTSIKVNRRE